MGIRSVGVDVLRISLALSARAGFVAIPALVQGELGRLVVGAIESRIFPVQDLSVKADPRPNKS
jgi:hypothetical protein